jgi:hypothetical protein
LAIAQGNTRFEICGLVSKGLKIMHQRGVRFEDTIGDVLGMLARKPEEQHSRLDLNIDKGAEQLDRSRR